MNVIVTVAFNGVVNVKDFGAVGDGVHDDAQAIQDACDYCIANPALSTTVRFPVGRYKISKSILLQNSGSFFTVKLSGDSPAKTASDQYLSRIDYMPTSGYAIGIQRGRNIKIENLSIQGQYKFPNSVGYTNIGTLKFSEWNDGSVTDSRYAPYAGIVIDPHENTNGSTGGTSGVEISQSAVKQFMVGIALSPNGVTQNAEMINILDCNVEANRIAIAVCQDQSKEIHIDRLKCWSSTHTILDGVNYGAGTGGGSVMMNGANIAGCVNQLFNFRTDRFPFSANNIYAESLFRIGTIRGYAGAVLDNSLFDLIGGTGLPAPDYLFSGGPVVFRGGAIRYYDNDYTKRLNFSQAQHDKVVFRDITLSSYPLTRGLYGIPTNQYPAPIFDNVTMYYNQSEKDTLIKFSPPYIYYNTANWTASFTGAAGVMVGDYILASGNSSTVYYDNPARCPTIQIGRVVSIVGEVVTLDNVGLNATYGGGSDAYYISRLQ